MTGSPELGRLERVALRDAWLHEASSFTPWLAQPENLALLSETIGLDLEVQATEERVGPFRADIFCTETVTGARILIENQIERTDHTHLGQILTYAAGLDAVTVVWIAAQFTAEHRAALDWLNDVSHEEIRFFGLEVELWRIGNSAPAPRFNVVARPNDWSKAARESASAASGADSEARRRHHEFWTAFCDRLRASGSSLSGARKPGRENWMSWGIGRSGFALVGVTNSHSNSVSAQLVLYPPDGIAHFRLLSEQRAAIEAEFGAELTWDLREDRGQNYVYVSRTVADLDDRSSWPAIQEWLQDALERLDRILRTRVAALYAADWDGASA